MTRTVAERRSPSRAPSVLDGPFLRRLAYAGARFGPQALVRWSPTIIGAVCAAALPSARAAMRRNVRRVKGARGPFSEAVDVVEALVGYAHCLAETLAADRTDVERVGRVVGADHLEAALESHRGAIVVTAHTGAWDFAAHLLTTCGAGNGRQVPVVMVMAPEVHPEAAAVQDAQRRRLGLEVRRIGHPIDSLPLVRHLREGGVVAIQLDRAGTSGRVRSVPFCGSRIDLPDGPLHLAAMTGAPIVPVFTWRRGFFDYLLELFPPVYLPRRPRPEQFDEAARSVAESMERFFRRHPTHWFDFSAALPLEDT